MTMVIVRLLLGNDLDNDPADETAVNRSIGRSRQVLITF